MIAEKEVPRVSGGLPVLGHAIDFLKNPTKLISRGYEEHGKIFSMKFPGQNIVVMLGPEHNKFVFDQSDKILSTGEAYPFFGRMFNKNFFSMGGQEAYHQQRGIILPCFRATVMPNYIDVMVLQTIEFIDKLGDQGTFDLTTEFGHLVMKVAAYSFFGKDFDKELGDSIFDDFRDFAKGMDPITPGWIPTPHSIKSQKAKRKLADRIIPLIQQRRENPINPPDFLQTILESKNKDGSPVSDIIMKDLIVMLMWAGHETTAGHISWALIDLLQNPAYLDTVLEQYKEVFEGKEKFTMEEAKKLKKIEWAIKETERMNPVVMSMARKVTETFERDGYKIPKGSMVYISPPVSHQLPDIFPNPKKYDPMRFATGKQIKNSLIGFGGGIHRCTGVNFAYLEMKVVLTLLLEQYDFELVNPKPKGSKSIMVKWPEDNSMVRYKRRKNAPKINKELYQNENGERACSFN